MSTISSGLSSLASSANATSSVPTTGLGAVSSSTGLISGIPIQQTVNALLALDEGPRNHLQTQDTTIQSQQAAYTQIEALLQTLEATTNGLATSSLYSNQSLTSSNTSLLTATSNGTVAPGTYSYTPVRLAAPQQFSSNNFSSLNSPVGAGTVTIGYGGAINNGVSLDLLNQGQGFSPGEIQITDRSGATATIDLSQARTVNDVINDINSNTSVHVTATAVGNSFQLTDDTGQTASNLKVSDVNGGTTAESLGLGSVNVAANQAQGTQVLSLFNGLPLSQLNQGVGVQFDGALPDLNINFQDGTSTNVDFSTLPTAGTFPSGTTDAVNGTNAAVTFTANNAGSDYAGVSVVYQNSPTLTAGNETVSYDSTKKILTFQIDSGHTTANDIANAVKNNATVSALFTATANGSGTGLVSVSDTTLTTGPQSTATTSPLNANAGIKFTAVQGGSNYDGVAVSFVDNPSITAGHETVAYDASAKTLTFQIAAGQTTASDVISALNDDPTASKIFTAAAAAGSNGSGLVSTSDTATSSGGAIIEPTAGSTPTTLGDVLAALNAAAPGKLQASIATNGQSIQLTDLTSGSGTFSVSDLNNSHAAADLGLTAAASGGTIIGNPVLGGLQSSLLRGLNGGAGLGTLGSVQITDRSGNTATVDLSQAQTVDDVIGDINNAGIGVKASINQAGDGILLTDSSGGTASNLIVANADSTDTADKLGLTTNAATTSVNSGNLHLQTVSENTSLASLNGGKGIAEGTFTIADSNGATAQINVNSKITTVGELIGSINAQGIGIKASINSTGDGILLTDAAHGKNTLTVTEGNSTTAAGLHLLSAATTTTVGGVSTQTIDGSSTATITTSATDTVQDLINKINNSGVAATASLFSDGSSVNPYSLKITSAVAGQAGSLLINTSGLNLNLSQSVAGQDALLEVNTPGTTGTLVSSATDTFNNVLPNATLNITGTSTTPVSVTVASDSSTLVTTIQTLVSEYNATQSALSTATAYTASSNTAAVLQGDPVALQTQSQLASLITQPRAGFGNVQSLADLGVSINQDGTLSFNSTTLQNIFASDPTDVENFLSDANNGLSQQFKTTIESLSGATNSLLTNKTNALNTELTSNQAQITQDNSSLSAEQTRLLDAFYNQEAVLAKLQSAQQAVNSITVLAPSTDLSSLAYDQNTLG